MARYRAPLPEWAPGSTRIFAADLAALVKAKQAVLVDVMAAEGGGYDPATGEWRLTKIHDTIPGSIWLPDVGRGRIDTRIESYFTSNLNRLTEGDKARAIVIFCQSDCWMSWNAVRRAALLGYQHIYWLRRHRRLARLGRRDHQGTSAPGALSAAPIGETIDRGAAVRATSIVSTPRACISSAVLLGSAE